MANQITQVSNMDVAGLCDRLTMYALELVHSQSAFNGGVILEQDRNRTATYIDRLETFAASVSANGSLDLPKIHNVGYSLVKAFPSDTAIESVENQDIKDILRRFKAMWVDLSESQSADLVSGLNRFDLERMNAVLDSCRNILELSGTELDLPENVGNTPTPNGLG